MSSIPDNSDKPNSSDPVLSVVVLSWNTQKLTLACMAALFAEVPKYSREVIVVDNGSGIIKAVRSTNAGRRNTI